MVFRMLIFFKEGRLIVLFIEFSGGFRFGFLFFLGNLGFRSG